MKLTNEEIVESVDFFRFLAVSYSDLPEETKSLFSYVFEQIIEILRTYNNQRIEIYRKYEECPEKIESEIRYLDRAIVEIDMPGKFSFSDIESARIPPMAFSPSVDNFMRA